MMRFALLVAGVLAIATASSTTQFGPSKCVSLSRSKEGSCLIKTNCAGQDTSDFDFSFDCVTQAKRTHHSFGVGSFDDVEEYDTGVVCDTCADPAEPASLRGNLPVAAKKAPAVQAKVLTSVGSKKVQKATTKKISVQLAAQGKVHAQNASQNASNASATSALKSAVPAGEKAFYGPSACVSLWRSNETGTCIMETACGPPEMSAAVDLTSYEFGLLCVDADNKLTRQLFGKDSFNHNEVFDTLIKCTHCLSLDEVTRGGSAMTPDVEQDLSEIKSDLATMGSQIAKLNAAVFAPAPASVQPASPAAFVVQAAAVTSAKVATSAVASAAVFKKAAIVAAVQLASPTVKAPAVPSTTATPVASAQDDVSDQGAQEDQGQEDDGEEEDDN